MSEEKSEENGSTTSQNESGAPQLMAIPSLDETAKLTTPKEKKSPNKKSAKPSRNESLDELPEELRTLAKIHNDPKTNKSMGMMDGRKSVKGSKGGITHNRSTSGLSTSSGQDNDEDEMSVDSEAEFVYVPGMKMNDEEAKDLLKQLTDKKKRIESVPS